MARFDRKVERTKKEYQFTQKEKVVETNKYLFKNNFNLKTILVFIIDFLIVTLLIIPILMQYLNEAVAFVVGHGFITSLLIVLTGCLVNREKPKMISLFARFLFMFILLGASSGISMMITSWLN